MGAESTGRPKRESRDAVEQHLARWFYSQMSMQDRGYCRPSLEALQEKRPGWFCSRQKWNIKTATAEAKRYSSRIAFSKNNQTAYYWFFKTNNQNLLDAIHPRVNARKLELASAIEQVMMLKRKGCKNINGLEKENKSLYSWFVKNNQLPQLHRLLPPLYIDSVKEAERRLRKLVYGDATKFHTSAAAAYLRKHDPQLFKRVCGLREKRNQDPSRRSSELEKYNSLSDLMKCNMALYQWCRKHNPKMLSSLKRQRAEARRKHA